MDLSIGAQVRLAGYVYDYMRIFDEGLAKALASSMTTHTPEALSRAVAVLAEAGCDEVFLVPSTADPVELDRTREALGL